MRRAKIVCTLGPASDDRATIRDLADAGMAVARLNASHGTPAERAVLLDRVRAVDDATEDPLASMVDLRGPEVRTAPVDAPVDLSTGTTVRFVEGETVTADAVGLSHDVAAVAPGDRILLDDGRIETEVESVDGSVVTARVVSGGELGSRKGVNVPGVDLGLDVVTDADRRDLEVAVEHDADFVAASFVRDAADVYAVTDAVERFGGDVPVIAKIERAGAVDHVDELIEAAYGVMVARGDLGVECPLEDVPMVQKRIVRRAQEAGVPVITATEMLDSMVTARRPTRAEASDVANAVLDGSDAVMLSGETAVGDHPVHVVETMDRIVREVEGSEEYAESREAHVPEAVAGSQTEALARAARFLAQDLGAAAVVAVSESGYTARRTAKFRPSVPVVATTPRDRVRRQLALSWGVDAQYAAYREDIDEMIEAAVDAALDAGVAESGDTVIVLSGMMTQIEGTDATNTLKVHVAAETVATGRSVASGRVAGPVFRCPDGNLGDAPAGAVVVLPAAFDDHFEGDTGRIGGVVDANPGMTSYAALVARERGVPMIGDATLPDDVADGETVTLDADRGVIYEGDVIARTRRR
jgi:pyruvate kinase